MFATHVRVRSNDQTNRTSRIFGAEPEQLSAVQYRFRLEGRRMFGTLISSHTSGHINTLVGTVESELHTELVLWDSLSDEALTSFEDLIA